MRDLSLSQFADTILKQDESNEQEDGQFAQSASRPRKKQKVNNNNAMVNTALGADGYSALSQTQHCNTECVNKQDANACKKTAEQRKWIKVTLTLVKKHKEWCEKEKQLLLAIAPSTSPHPNCLDYFEFDANQTSKDSCIAMLHLMAPGAKVLSKSKDIQCQTILQEIVPTLSKELFDSKESCLRMELAMLNHVSGSGEMDETMIEPIDNDI